jgi:hypothetical protein
MLLLLLLLRCAQQNFCVNQVTIDPIKNHAWRCASAADAACAAVWAAPTSHDFCELPASAWEWTNLGEPAEVYDP